MKKAWRIMGTIILTLAIAGAIAAGIGLITGASADRMVENVFGGWEDFELILDVLRQELGGLFPLGFMSK